MSETAPSLPAPEARNEAMAPEPSPVVQPALRGIGGWLMLPAISIVLAPIVLAYLGLRFAGFYARPNLSPGEFSYITFELVIIGVMLILWVIAGVLFFKRKRIFPKFFIGLLVLDGLSGLFSYNLRYGDSETESLVRGLVALAVWAPYMFVSERVRNTFVR
jgi:hypothetical protein